MDQDTQYVTAAVPSDKHTFRSGASSSGQKPRYDRIPTWALARLADRMALGAEKYGDDNWKKGLDDKDFILDRLNHGIEHLFLAAENIRNGMVPSDDDLAAAIVNCIFAMGYQRERGEAPGDIPF